jgi:hypothetical protein
MGSRAFVTGAVLLTVVALTVGPTRAAEMKGVAVPDTVQVGEHTLTLQGIGLRKKFVFSVYVAALYLKTPSTDAAAVIGAEEPKRITLHFLRDVPADNIREAFEDGFFKNSQEKLDRLRARIDRFFALFDREAKEGQAVSFTYLPDQGTRVAVGEAEKGSIEGRDFMGALWAIWLGDVPPSHDLKRSMLGLP